MNSQTRYSLIDLFAGPGGLGEGFASVADGDGHCRFRCVLSVEKDKFAHETLKLRHFIHAFDGTIPAEYYDFLRGKISLDELYAIYQEEHSLAEASALKMSLSQESRKRIKQKIKDTLDGENMWVLVGGPPCQSYSLIGRSGIKKEDGYHIDPRHYLHREYAKVIHDHNPPVFVMENVKGLLSLKTRSGLMINTILHKLSNPGNGFGYNLFSLSPDADNYDADDPRRFIIRAEEHGVPQSRHRIFIVGIRDDFNVKPRALEIQNAPSIKNTIGNLPDLRSGLSRTADSFENWKSILKNISNQKLTDRLNWGEINPVMAEISYTLNLRLPMKRKSASKPRQRKTKFPVLDYIHDSMLGITVDHETRSHIDSDVHRYFYAAIFARVFGYSPKLVDFPETLMPNHKSASEERRRKVFSDRFRVQLANSVSSTITSHIAKDGHHFIHYDPKQARSLTVREAARLQTFPDNYKFLGNRTSQYQQVGNAVPPYLAKQIGEIVAEVLDQAKAKK